MIINCEMCDKRFEHRDITCPNCEHDNVYEDITDKVVECCDNCKYFEPTYDIQCAVLAKLHKWDRLTLEIDSIDTFRCQGYKNA